PGVGGCLNSTDRHQCVCKSAYRLILEGIACRLSVGLVAAISPCDPQRGRSKMLIFPGRRKLRLVAPIEYTLADAIGAAQLYQVPHLQDFNVAGPFTVSGVSDTPSRRKVFKCRPVTANEEVPCATNIITALARQAYRRPVTQEDLEGLLAFYEMGRKDADFESGIRTALQAIMASPTFVFRLEQRPAGITSGQNYRINDLELASRLSYFLWSTAPDDALITVAGAGKLHDPVELEKQVRRMLADPRSESLSTRFAAQWLRLAEVDNVVPDGLLY